MSEMVEISYPEALRIILAAVEVLPSHRISIEDALGYALAEDVAADFDLPAFENSAMDGYAIRSADAVSASPNQPVQLRIVGSAGMGTRPAAAVGPGEAVSIGTGGMLPPGADAVVRLEEADLAGDLVVLRAPVPKHRDIRHVGEDVTRGKTVLTRGQTIGPAEVAVLAGVRREPTVSLIARPHVAILTVGDELAEPGAPVDEGKIRNVNLPALMAQATEAGCAVVPLGVARDDPDEIEDRLGRGTAVNALVVAGGVSTGARDYTRRVISRLGEICSWRIRMRPVRPFGFGRIGRLVPSPSPALSAVEGTGEGQGGGEPQSTLVFALPGNPVAAALAFELLVRPALRKLAGHARLGRPSLIAAASEPIDNRGGTLNFVRAVLHEMDGVPMVHASIPQGTHMLRSLALANCLVEVPEGTERVDQGEPVRVRLLSGEG